MAKKSFVIVDGFALIFRAYYAFINNPLRTSTGMPTSAIFGFLRMLMKVIKDYKPDYIVVAWESKEKTFRSEIFPDYKANRAEPPDELKIQIPLILKAVEAFKFPAISVSGYEADDVIATLVTQYKEDKDLDIYILSSDKDLMQLVGGNVKCITSTKGITDIKILDREGVKEKYGVYPEKILEYLTLTGDSADNIPGVKGIGPKTAIKLLEDFGTIDEILSHLDRVKGKIKENIARSRKEIELSRQLVRLETHIPLQQSLSHFILPNFNQAEGVALIEEYELHSLLKDPLFGLSAEKITEKTPAPNVRPAKVQALQSGSALNNVKGKYSAVTSRSMLDKIIEDIKISGIVALDTETTSEQPVRAKIIGVSLCIKSGEAYYIPLEHQVEKDFDNEYALGKIKEIAENPEIKIIGQNIKYDYIILKNSGITINNVYFDTLIASYVLDSSRPRHNMDYLAETFLGYTTVKYNDLVDTKKGQTLLDVDFEKVVEYSAEDADITFRLYEVFSKELEKNKLNSVFYDVDMPVVSVLSEMEIAGVKINEKHMQSMGETFGRRIIELEQEVHKIAGAEINVNSTQQLSKVLFDTLGLKPTKKTKTGFSTDSQVLEDLQGEHPIIDTILEHRKLSKMKSTYLDALPPLIFEKTGRIHASFNQIVTATGRLSSSDPNMQNIPIRGETGSDIRQCFIPENGHYIISADYSQIELRILAHVTKDDILLKAYSENADIHIQTASLIYDVSPDKVAPEMRSNAKTINFAVIYGRGARNLAKDLKITVDEAQKFRNRYFEKYSGVRDYVELVHDKSCEAGFVKTLFGRIRYLSGFDSDNQRDVAQAERMAFNTIIQGTAADIIKIAMKKVYLRFKTLGLKSRMIIQVHDELVFEVPENELSQARSIIKEEMENAVKLDIPLTVNVGAGKNWDEAH